MNVSSPLVSSSILLSLRHYPVDPTPSSHLAAALSVLTLRSSYFIFFLYAYKRICATRSFLNSEGVGTRRISERRRTCAFASFPSTLRPDCKPVLAVQTYSPGVQFSSRQPATLDHLDKHKGAPARPRSGAAPSSPPPPAPPPHDYLRSPAQLSSPSRVARLSQLDEGSFHSSNTRPPTSHPPFAGSPFLQGSPGASSTSSLPAGAAPAFPLRRLQQHATGTERVTYAEEQRQLAAQERRTSPLPAIPSLEGAGSGGQSSGRTRQLLTRRADDHPLEPPTASPEPSLFHSHSTLGNCTQHSSATQQHPRALASPLQASSRRDLSHDASTHDSQPNTSRPPPSHFYNSLTPSQRIARGGQSELSPEPSSRSGNIFGIGGVPAHQSRREDDRAPPPPNKSAPRQETSSSRRPAAPPVTPPPKRSFFGLGGKISAPKPPPSHSKPASSTLQKSRALPSAHARRSSGGEIGRSLSSTPVRSSATAAYRTSQSVGRTTTRPDRNTVAETWVVLDAREPTDQLPPVPPHQRLSRFPQRSHEPRGNGSQTPPPHRASARDPSTGFASPPFYAASPRTSDSHGSFESGADLQRIRSLGDARDWSWNQTLEGYQGPRSGTPVHSREGTQESLEEARAEVVVRPARRSSLMPMGAERVEYATSPPGEFILRLWLEAKADSCCRARVEWVRLAGASGEPQGQLAGRQKGGSPAARRDR